MPFPDMTPKTNELSVETNIAAPPEAVWKLMTDRMTEWWCPKPWYTEIVEQNWHAGGRSAMVMKGPEGEAHPVEGLFLEVTPGVRFVTTDAVTADMRPAGPFMIGIWEIQPDGNGGTNYKASARHWSEENMREHEMMGFTDGWAACAQQLKELAESEA